MCYVFPIAFFDLINYRTSQVIPNLNDKESMLLSRLSRDPTLGVADLAREFDVTSVTMRSYLAALADKGYIYRVRGGAVPTIHPNIIERESRFPERKRAIAERAAALVGDGDTIMLEAGTTTALIMRYLMGKRDVSVVTTNTLALAHARGNPGISLTIVGGEYRPASESVVGPIAVEQLNQFHVHTAFVGTDGFSPDIGLTTHLVEGAEIVRRMADRAEGVVVVADSSKFGNAGFVRVLPLQRVDVLITDDRLAPDASEAIRECGVELITVAL